MSFLQENYSENLAGRITNKGRKKIAQGNFIISYFQVGDSEFDYAFSEFNGNDGQKVLMPFDKDSQVKYPYKVSSSLLTGTTYGIPIESSEMLTICNRMGAAGYVSGTTVVCGNVEIQSTELNASSTLNVPDGSVFSNTEYITIVLAELSNNVIESNATSFVYKIVTINANVLTLDRATPDFSGLNPFTITVICNYCDPSPNDAEDQQDPWTLNTVWSSHPAGLDPTVDEKLSGYTSNLYVSAKEYFGYNTSSGQTSNTGTTITNSFGDIIPMLPEEQHSLSILHYSRPYSALSDFDLIFKYDDYIAHTIVDEIDTVAYFEVYIPFLQYERNTGSTIGARFFMDSTDYYINSAASDTKVNQMKFRYLLDEQNVKVGKIFINHKIIIFDDQEIIAALDYKSNRRHTLPIPRSSSVPIDTKCDVNGDPNNPLLGGTGDTVFVSYILEYTGDTASNGLHCNHYSKIIGSSTPSDVSIKFNTTDFKFMGTTEWPTTGYIANKFEILVQQVTTGQQPDPRLWRIIDFTSEIPNHNVGDIIDPDNLRGTRFIITNSDYTGSTLYNLENYMGAFPDEPSTAPEFGDEQPFTGSVKLVRATDLEVMRYLVNLPSGYFETTQNPSYTLGDTKRITEVALMDSNKDVLVIAKASSPIERVGTQVLAVQIDI